MDERISNFKTVYSYCWSFFSLHYNEWGVKLPSFEMETRAL